MALYKIVRMFQRSDKANRTIERGLTLEEAQVQRPGNKLQHGDKRHGARSNAKAWALV